MFERLTRNMTLSQRHDWWENQAKADYRKYGGKGLDDLGPDIRFPKGKRNCHGLRRKLFHGDWWEEPAGEYYHQAHATRTYRD